MNFIKNSNVTWSIKLPVLIMYLLFLTVQVFFNLDIVQRSPTRQAQFHLANLTTTHKESVKQLTAKTSFSPKIRLNKRFQPSSIPSAFIAIAEILLDYARPEQIGLCDSNLYGAVFLYTHTLRGPPVVA